MPSVYFNEKQLEVIRELCNTWYQLMDGVSVETEMNMEEFNEIVSQVSAKVHSSIGKVIRKRELDDIVQQALKIAKR